MTTDLMDVSDLRGIEVEDYGSRRASDAPSSMREGGGSLSIPALVALTAALMAFVAVAVYFSQLAGAC